MVAVLRSIRATATACRVRPRRGAVGRAGRRRARSSRTRRSLSPRDFDIRPPISGKSLRAKLAAPERQSAGAEPKLRASSSRNRPCCRQRSPASRPPTKGATDIYALGIAGWADQDVFLKELDGGLAAIGGVLPIRGRTLRLVNHRETIESVPLANQRNFAAAVHAIGDGDEQGRGCSGAVDDVARRADRLRAAAAERSDRAS